MIGRVLMAAGDEDAKTAIALARVLWVVAIASVIAALALAVANGWNVGVDPEGTLLVSAVLIGSLGTLVVGRRPSSVIGWMMVVIGVLDGLAIFGLQYGLYGVVTRPGSLPAAEAIGTIPYGAAIGISFGLLITFFLLLFPDGKLPSRRWRPVAWIGAIGIVLMVVGLTLIAVDFGVEGIYSEGTLAFDASRAEGLPRVLNEAGHALVFLVFPLAVLSLFVRRRRAGPTERHQLRWFAYGAVVFLVSIFAPLPDPLGLWFEVAATGFLFVAIAVAILRYRLYDIDRIVSRTVSYALVSGLLVALFLGIVFVFGSVLPFEGDLAVAASTLAVAASFNPLRRRVQSGVDRRFNRSRYDALHTVDLFAQRLREEVDLEDLRVELSAVTTMTMQPEHLSLWLRDESSSVS